MTRLPLLFKRHSLYAVLSLSLLSSAQAFTLSSPQILSKQGDPLRVELDVIEMSVEEQLDFAATLASSDIYRTAQLEMPSNNGASLGIQVNLLRRSNGKAYILISSKEPFSKTFVDLMIDFRWSNGRSLRNIAVALTDPHQQAASTKPSATVAVEPTPAPIPNLPANGLTTSTASSAPLPTPVVKAPKVAEQSHSKPQHLSPASVHVKRGDTAGNIAAENLPEGVSLEQMLVAMLRENPEAFVDQNVNRLKAGSLLNMPSDEAARQVSASEAHKAISIQTHNFNAYRAGLAEHAATGHIPKASRDTGGKLEAQLQKPAADANKDTLKLSKPGTKTEAENKVAHELQAKEVANRAAEMSRNIEELKQIASATAASDAASHGEIAITPPSEIASQAQDNASESANLFNDLLDDEDNWVMGGGILAFLLAAFIWIRHRKNQNQSAIEGLPPVDVKFNIDLPMPADSADPMAHSEVIAQAHDVDLALYDVESNQHANESTSTTAGASSLPPKRPLPDISLDLNDAPEGDNPFQVRIDLANELWQLGQQHTSRALMEEVAHEASGEIKAYAQKWLAERG
jgi:FimV-like protein